MSMTVKRKGDTETPRVIMHKVADIRGGVSIDVTELGGKYLREGTVLSAPVNGICHVVKVGTAVVAVAAAATEIKVTKYHNFKAGDFVCVAVGGKAVKIDRIDTTSKEYDVITLSAALGALEVGGQIMEAVAAATGPVEGDGATAATGAELKYKPLSIVGTGMPIEADTNLITDAWVMAVTKDNPLPADIAGELKGIINY